jgi:Tannase and feruloyl esterase
MDRRRLQGRPYAAIVLAVGSMMPGTSPLTTILVSSPGFAAPPEPAAACTGLAALRTFPVASTEITGTSYLPAGSTSAEGVALPGHCRVQGIIGKRMGTDGFPYGTSFEIRLPSDWNGRFMFQGGGGTEGTVPPATGVAGMLSPTLARGWAVASQNGGHDSGELPVPNQFFLEPQAVADHAYHSIDVTTQTAKFLIDAYYGRRPDHSYFVGCSTGGRQGMVLSQNFPDYYDGIVAGAPVYDLEAVALGENWDAQAVAAITPASVRKFAQRAGAVTPSLIRRALNHIPLWHAAFPDADQKLFTRAVLAACDGLDGAADGVIDDLPACQAKFDPATFVFPDSGQPLQCAGAKTAACLSPEQIGVVKKIKQGPRNSLGEPIRSSAVTAVRDHADNTVVGYAWDGGFMTPAGIPPRKFWTPFSPPGDFAQALGQMSYTWVLPANPGADPLRFDFDKDIGKLNGNTPMVSYSASTDMTKFKERGGKIIWYHGVSDPGPPVLATIAYYDAVMARNGGWGQTATFSRLFLVPNMGHCGGGPSTDQFDMLTPLVSWVERRIAPDRIIASGTRFASPPAIRSRPLCPYPQQTRYTGPAGGDLGQAANYSCIAPSGR